MNDTPESSSDPSFSCGRQSAPRGADDQGAAVGHSPAVDQSRSLAPSDSPCVAICSTLYDEICRGCGRTTMEVANWVFLSEEERLAIWTRIKSQGYPRR